MSVKSVLLAAAFAAITSEVPMIAAEKQDVVTAARPAQGDLSAFLGEPSFVMHRLYGQKRGGRKVITAQDGTVLAFHGRQVRRSTDGGKKWGKAIDIGPDALGANAIVDETTGAVMLVNPHGHRLVSHNAGLAWKREDIEVRPNLVGHGSSEKDDLFSSAMQPGITLSFGKHKGRLLVPVRWAPKGSVEWRPYIYNTAIYSDDRGKTWQTAAPFPVNGTGEAALAELSDGRILDVFWTFDRVSAKYLNIHARESLDNGRTWSDMWDTGVPGQPAPPVSLPNGRIAMVYVDRTAEPKIKVRVSSDRGRSWPDETEGVIHDSELDSQTWNKGSMQDAWAEMGKFSLGLPVTAGLEDGGLLVAYYSGPHQDATNVEWARLLPDD